VQINEALSVNYPMPELMVEPDQSSASSQLSIINLM